MMSTRTILRLEGSSIIGVLREQEAGAKTADLARKHGVSAVTLYNWKAKYGGLDVSANPCHSRVDDGRQTVSIVRGPQPVSHR